MEQESFAEDFYANTIPEDWKEHDVHKRLDGTFEITYFGMPYHCVPEMTELFEAVSRYAEENPDKIIIEKPYVPTEEELKQREIENNLINYKKNLNDTDYVVIKISEAVAAGDEEEVNKLKEKYAETLKNREMWREYVSQYDK